jgi:putative MATE family efflux protein
VPRNIKELKQAISRSFSLSTPLMAEQFFNTLMRTVDIFITGLFSPAAIAAIGIADVYAQLSMRVGHGLGGGAISLSSQDTGGQNIASRDEVITQSLLLGLLLGIPLAIVGLLFGQSALDLLGAPSEVSKLGGLYLSVVLLSAPADIITIVGSKALQGTGDTRTPTYILIAANVLNILLSVLLGLGVGPFPELSLLGVGIGTTIANFFSATLILFSLTSTGTLTKFRFPRNITVTRQLFLISAPQMVSGIITTAVYFPFNALLLLFGIEVTAAYHIGRRMYHQLTGPFYRAYSTVASIVVGQAVGKGDTKQARFEGWVTTGISLVVLTIAGSILFLQSEFLVSIFTSDPLTIFHATNFAKAFSIAIIFVSLYFSLAGALQGAGDAMTPFIARTTGFFGVFLGVSYLLSVPLNFGVHGIYAGIILSYAWMASIVFYGFSRKNWELHAVNLIKQRHDSTNNK